MNRVGDFFIIESTCKIKLAFKRNKFPETVNLSETKLCQKGHTSHSMIYETSNCKKRLLNVKIYGGYGMA